MNKAAGIGVIIAIIIGIIIVSAGVSMDSVEIEESIPVEEESPIFEEVEIEESISVEEVVEESIPVEEEPEETGRDLTVELTESIGLKTP